MASTHSSGASFLPLVIIGVLAVVWWIPTIIAVRRDSPDKAIVVIIDGLFGWNPVGWGIAMWIACRRPR
jgi:hypothetical protein